TGDDHPAVAIERVDDVGERPQRHEPRAANARDVPFELLPHVDQLQLLAARQPALQLARRDLDEPTHRPRLRLRRPHTAKLLVIDERLDLVRATPRTRWVLPDVNRAELHPPRLDDKQPAS